MQSELQLCFGRGRRPARLVLGSVVVIEQEHDWLLFASVGAPHGIRGAFFCLTLDHRVELLGYPRVGFRLPGKGTKNQNGTEESVQARRIVKSYMAGGRPVIHVDGIATREEAETLKGCEIFVSRSDIAVAEDEVLVADLIGTSVFDEHGGVIGAVCAVHDFGAQETLEIRLAGETDNGTILFPFVAHFIRSHDIEAKTMTVVNAGDFGIEGA
jgi:16S rRNA processing protein RimM